MKLFLNIRSVLTDHIEVLRQLEDESYIMPCEPLSNATIGQHTRHFIELFLCLLHNYHQGFVEYDSRNRDSTIETNAVVAIQCIEQILEQFNLPDKQLVLRSDLAEIQTNYYRELLYNLEHSIHHQALIKVALISFNLQIVSAEFGVAPSTIKYRKECAQ